MSSIKIVASDLRLEETNIQAIRIFEHLDKLVDDIFDKIDSRIERNTQRINNVNKRIEIASNKIETFKKSKKAIRIYSPAKYPIEPMPRFQPTFSSTLSDPKPEFNDKLDNVPFDNVDYKYYSDKLQFFHLKRHRQTQPGKPSLMHNARSINSLISFTNNENILSQEAPIRYKSTKDQTLANVAADDTTDFSRFSSLIKNKHDDESFHYFPNLNTAPEVELPFDLPDLVGVADDISFTLSDQEFIAPSLKIKMNLINELPNVDMLEAESSKKTNEISLSKIPAVREKHTVKNEISKQEVDIPKPPPIPITIPQAPPPPPPIPMMATAQKIADETPQAKESNVGDARSSLMAAIRQAGGKSKLRSIPAAEEETVVQQQNKKVQSAPADFMADLHQKLIMRHRAMNADSKKITIMQKVSSLIPAPQADSDSESLSSNNGSEWE